MNKIILALALVVGSVATAHETDDVPSVSQDQIENAKALPQTVVIRRSLNNPEDISVIHLAEKLAPNTKLSKEAFEKIALNAEVTGLAYDASDEKDKRSSRSSWAFGIYGSGPYGNTVAIGARGGYGYGAGAVAYRGGYGYADGGCGGGGCDGGCGGYDNGCYYPSFRYNNFQYDYASYYRYQDNSYSYDLCGWNNNLYY